MYNEGISLAGDTLDTGVEYGMIKKSGNSYTYGEEKLGVGRENAKNMLRERPDLMKAIRAEVIEAWKSKERTEDGSAKQEGDDDSVLPDGEGIELPE
jgi:recombination protein RecA